MRALILAGALVLAAPAVAQDTSLWRSQSSSYRVTKSGNAVIIVFHEPSSGVQLGGARAGSPFFEGRGDGTTFTGRQNDYFAPACPSPTFAATVTFAGDDQLTLVGRHVSNYNTTSCQANSAEQLTVTMRRVAPPRPPTTASAPVQAPTTAPPASVRSTADQLSKMAAFPFRCVATGGAPSVTQSETYYYDLRGSPQSRRISICDPSNRADCNGYDVFEYDIMCEGGVVSAAQLAAATRKQSENYPLELRGNTLYAVFWRNRQVNSGGWTMDNSGRMTGIQMPSFQFEKVRTGEQALPEGAGPAPRPDIQAGALPTSITVIGNRSPALPNIPALGYWQELFAAAFPWLKGAGIVLFAAYAAITFFGFETLRTGLGKVALAWSLAALLGLFFLPVPFETQQDAQAQVSRQAKAIQEQVLAIERDEAKLRSLVRYREGRYEPVSQTTLNQIRQLAQPRSLPTLQAPADVSGLAIALIAPALAFMVFFAWPFYKGAHYVFVRHPAASHIDAIQRGDRGAGRGLAKALMQRAAWIMRAPARFRLEQHKQKAEDVADTLAADIDVANKAEELARARRRAADALMEAKETERRLAEAEAKAGRRKSWWK